MWDLCLEGSASFLMIIDFAASSWPVSTQTHSFSTKFNLEGMRNTDWVFWIHKIKAIVSSVQKIEGI